MSTTATIDPPQSIPAGIVAAVRDGLTRDLRAIREGFARSTQLPGEESDRERLERLEATEALLELIGREPARSPIALEVDLNVHRAPLTAAVRGELERKAQALSEIVRSGDRNEREGMLTQVNMLDQYLGTIEAR